MFAGSLTVVCSTNMGCWEIRNFALTDCWSGADRTSYHDNFITRIVCLMMTFHWNLLCEYRLQRTENVTEWCVWNDFEAGGFNVFQSGNRNSIGRNEGNPQTFQPQQLAQCNARTWILGITITPGRSLVCVFVCVCVCVCVVCLCVCVLALHTWNNVQCRWYSETSREICSAFTLTLQGRGRTAASCTSFVKNSQPSLPRQRTRRPLYSPAQQPTEVKPSVALETGRFRSASQLKLNNISYVLILFINFIQCRCQCLRSVQRWMVGFVANREWQRIWNVALLA